MLRNNYEQLVAQYYTDCEGNPQSVHIIKKYQISPNTSSVILDGIPDMNNNIEVKDLTGQILNRVWNTDEVDVDSYYVWANGRISFDSSRNGTVIFADFYSIGLELISANRIFTYLDDKGNVIETLQEMVDKTTRFIDELDSIGGVIEGNRKLVENTSKANQTNDRMEKDISQSNDCSNKLEADIKDSIVKKNDLQNVINDSVNKNNTLKGTIKVADSLNNDLYNNIDKANTSNSAIVDNTKKADLSNIGLQSTIINATKVNDSININIGGKVGSENLLPNTGYPLKIGNFNTTTSSVEIAKSTTEPFLQSVYRITNNTDSEKLAFWNDIAFRMVGDTPVTESCYMYIDPNVTSAELYLLCYNEGGEMVFAQSTTFETKGKWFKAVNTVTVPNDKGIKSVQFRIDNNGVNNGQNGAVYFCYPKLERGSLATDWSPNYYDYKNQVGVTNLLANSGQMTNLKYWSLNKASNSNAEIYLDKGVNKGTHGVGAGCEVGGDWCYLQNTTLGDNGFKFVEGETYTLSGAIWIGDPSKTISFGICDDDGSNQVFGTTYKFNEDNKYYNDPNYNKFEFTFVAESTGNQNRVRIQLYNGVKIFIPFIKIEKGYFATDWCLSPYDLRDLQNKQEIDVKSIKDSCYTLSTNLNNNSKQIANNSSNIQDLKNSRVNPNLLSGTQFFDYGWEGGHGTSTRINKTNLFQGCAVQEQWFAWNYFGQVMCYEIGKIHTISCYAKCDKLGAKIYFTLAENMTAWGMQELTTEWKRYIFTFTPTLNKGLLRIESNCDNWDNNKVYISKIKLEKGSMATDWNINEFDYEHQIGGSNLLLNTGLDMEIDAIEKTGNFNFAIFNKHNGVQSIYNEKFLFLDNEDPFGDSYATLFKTVDYSLIPNSMYTVSFIYKCQYTGDTPSTSSYIKLVLNDDSIRWLQINDIDFKNSSVDWRKSIFTFEAPKDIKRVELRLGFRTNKYGWFAVNGIKLEKGLVSTDWNLSPYDIGKLRAKQERDIEWTNSHKIDKASVDNAPSTHDCNYFIEPNNRFIWDTGLGEFKNTPIGNLAQGSGIVFEIINYGTEGRIQQEFRKTYPLSETRTWIRSYSSDNGGQWTDWKSEFIGENEVGSSDDFNNLTRMGCWKVQGINGNTSNSPLKLDSNIYGYGLLNVYESGVAEEHRVLQVYFPHQVGGVGHRTPLIRMLNSGGWTAWDYIGATSTDMSSARKDIDTHAQQITSCRNDINTHTQQIASNSSAIQDIKNSWISTGDNRLCINGRSEIDVYAGGFYYIQGNSVTELHKIDHSRLADGQSIYFACETLDQVANIKFCRDDLVHWGVYTPAGKDFWITGRDNGDTIFEMKKMNGSLRFLGVR